MKKGPVTLGILILLFVVTTGCGNSIQLKKDQAHIIISENEIVMGIYMETDEDMDEDDYRDEFEDSDIVVKKLTIKNGYLEANLIIDEDNDLFESLFEYDRYELDEYIEDFWGDYDNAEDEDALTDAKTEKNAKTGDLEKFDDAYVLKLSYLYDNSFDKIYVTVPGKILFYSQGLELINKSTVAIDDDMNYYDVVVFE